MSARSLREVIEGQHLITGTGEMTVRAAASRMVEYRVGALLILAAGKLVGIFSERDALARVMVPGRNPDTTLVAEVMTRNPLTIPIDGSLSQALNMMSNHGIRHLPVLEGTLPVGIVTARDALGDEWIDFERQQEQQDEIASLLR